MIRVVKEENPQIVWTKYLICSKCSRIVPFGPGQSPFICECGVLFPDAYDLETYSEKRMDYFLDKDIYV
jgi:hypothetical protein